MSPEVENRLIQALLKQAEKISYYCRAEKVSPDLGVHEIRKSFKRIRALLKFLPDSMSEVSQEFIQQVGEHGRKLTLARESHVNSQLFRKVTESIELFSVSRMHAIESVFEENHKTVLSQLLEEQNLLAEIQSFIYALERKLTDWSLHPAFVINVVETLIYSYSKCYQLYQNDELYRDSELLHELRKKMKALWYQIDFAKYNQPKFFKLKSNALRKITERLGEDHDWYVFMLELKKDMYKIDASELNVIEKHFDTHQQENKIKIKKNLDNFFKDAPEVFNEKVRTNFQAL